jgi:hypothetical protein
MEALFTLVTDGMHPETTLVSPSCAMAFSAGMSLFSKYSGPNPSIMAMTIEKNRL